MASPSWSLSAADIAKIQDHSYEFLCSQFLDQELQARHIAPQLVGPPRRYERDRGADLEFSITQAPRLGRDHYADALTPDDIATYCVCCKTGADWKDALISDAGKKRPLSTVRNGGGIVAAVNIGLSPEAKADLHKKLVETLSKKTRTAGPRLEPRVIVIDANDLARTFAHHPFNLHPITRAALGLPTLDGLLDADEWMSFQRGERSLPGFVADDFRVAAIRALNETIGRDTADPRVVWIWGPPGAGKTRLITEAVDSNPAARRRTLFSPDFEIGATAIKMAEITARPGLILVVDECPKDEVTHLAAWFAARTAGQGSTLILVGPQSGPEPPVGFSGETIHLTPLDLAARRELATRELGLGDAAPSGLIDKVLNLTEGYPWFTILLTRALRDDPSGLPDGATEWSAAKFAIAGSKRDYGGQAAWEGAVRLRSKTLLAVLLTEGLDWKTLTSDQIARLASALDAPWADITECAKECRARGILRERQEWRFKYVTPNNLGRLVAHELLAPPSRTGHLLQKHVPELCRELYHRLEALGVRPQLLDSLAEDALRPFASTGDLNELASLPLTFLARRRPSLVAETLRVAVADTALDDLRAATEIRRELVFTLSHIVRRTEGFEPAESALFRLAQAENETWHNNATGIWTSLFFVALSLTHRAFDHRFAILEQRLTDGTAESRLLALKGLECAVGREHTGQGYSDDDTVDGEWWRPNGQQMRSGKMRAWRALLLLTDDPELGNEAREIVHRELWGADRWGVIDAVAAELAPRVGAWSQPQKAQLRETLSHLLQDRADAPWAAPLVAALSPESYHDRMLDVVGRWMPAAARRTKDPLAAERELDEELAARGLAPPDRPLLNELVWLESQPAVRAEEFMLAAGAVDSDRILLPRLLARASGGDALRTLPQYLGGVARSGGEREVDDLLRSWRPRHENVLHSLHTLWRLGPSEERIGWLVDDISSRRLEADSLGILAFGSWAKGATTDQLVALITALGSRNEFTPQVAAIWITHDDLAPSDPDAAAALLSQLVVAVAGPALAGMAAYKWREACVWLANHGQADAAARAALTAIGSSPRYGADDDAWEVMNAAASVDPHGVWSGIARLLEDKSDEQFRIALEIQSSGLVTGLPVDAVMRWIGDDERRSLLAAFMCSVHSDSLEDLPVALLERFGPHGPAARELAARAGSTPGVVTSLADFSKEQLQRAESWAADTRPAVAEWGRKLAEHLRSSYDFHSAAEEFEHRQPR